MSQPLLKMAPQPIGDPVAEVHFSIRAIGRDAWNACFPNEVEDYDCLLAIEEAGRRWGEPNGYILGQEAAGAFVGGLRYGEGTLYTRNAGDRRVFWQGPSIGFDFGGEGARTMMLVYNLPMVDSMYQRFAGVDGSAYFIGGFGFTALTAEGITVVPIRSGVGWRLGVNLGYLKFSPQATWNPF